MKWILYSRNSTKGFGLIELIVASAVSLIVITLGLYAINFQRKDFLLSQARSEAAQNLRAAMGLIGVDIKQAGERLESDLELPVINLQDGANPGDPDVLTLQRKLIADILPVCADVGGTQQTIRVVDNPGADDCTFSSGESPPDELTDTLNAFQDFRCQLDGDETCADKSANPSVCDAECTNAYIYDPVNDRGEFFLYTYEDADDAVNPTFNQIYASPFEGPSGEWRFNYNAADNPRIYILEDRQYALNNDVLEVTINHSDAPQRLVNQLEDFQVQIFTGGGWVDAFNNPGGWQNVQRVKITIIAQNPSESDVISIPVAKRTLESEFFPRNALSSD